MKRRKEKYLVTPLQKFSGKNPFNNDVCVDFEKRRVSFNPLTFQKLNSVKRVFLGNVYANSFILCILFAVPIALLTGVSVPFYMYIAYSVIVCSGITVIYLLLFNKSKYFRDEVYPKLNALLSDTLHVMLTFKRSKKTFRINPDSMINKQFIIPFFDNVVIEWEMTGTYKDNLKRIDIKHIFNGDAYTFFCLFTFKRKPQKGYMEVRYI